MYEYSPQDSIFDGVSNIYIVSIATAFLAVIMAFYCSNILKDESEKQLKEVLNVMGDDKEDDANYLNNTEIERQLELNPELQKRLKPNEIENDYDDSTSTSNYDESFVDGLVSKLKSKRIKDLEAQLTRDQLEEEKRIEREQLAAIFELLKKQETQLNMKEINESELKAQLALYR